MVPAMGRSEMPLSAKDSNIGQCCSRKESDGSSVGNASVKTDRNLGEAVLKLPPHTAGSGM